MNPRVTALRLSVSEAAWLTTGRTLFPGMLTIGTSVVARGCSAFAQDLVC